MGRAMFGVGQLISAELSYKMADPLTLEILSAFIPLVKEKEPTLVLHFID